MFVYFHFLAVRYSDNSKNKTNGGMMGDNNKKDDRQRGGDHNRRNDR